METPHYYRSFHNLHKQGKAKGFLSKENGQAFHLVEQEYYGYYVSDIFDSGQLAMSWDELHLFINQWSELDVHIWIFDDEQAARNLAKFSIMDRFYTIAHKGFTIHHTDILLYRNLSEPLLGRYLCFAFRTTRRRDIETIYTGYVLSFPSQRFSTYLPAFYQDNETLERYISVFKDIYLTLEQQVDRFSNELMLTTCSNEHVSVLLDWLGFSTLKVYADDERLRGFPDFYWQLSASKDTYAYWRELLDYLFQVPLHLCMKKACLHVYMMACGVKKAMQMETFLHNELPMHINSQLHIIHHPCLDKDAFLDATTLLFGDCDSRRLSNLYHLL